MGGGDKLYNEIYRGIYSCQVMVFPGIDFTNILWAMFACPDPESEKNTDNLTVSSALLGSAHVKAAHGTLMKLTPEVDFNIILQAFFKQKCFAQLSSTYNIWLCIFLAQKLLIEWRWNRLQASISILRAALSYESLVEAFLYLQFVFVLFLAKLNLQKAVHKILVKLTTDVTHTL